MTAPVFISLLPSAGPISPSDLLLIAQGVTGATRKITVQSLFGAATGGHVVSSGSVYQALAGDIFIPVNKAVGSATVVILPSNPVLWEFHTIKDGKGDAAANNIIVNGNGHTIDGASTWTIAYNRGYVNLFFDGTQWEIW